MPEETEVNLKNQIAQIMGSLLPTVSTNNITRFKNVHWCRRRSLCTLFAIIRDDFVVLFPVEFTDCVICVLY